ncbi:C-C motif chemokine 14-like [Pygocentrus nattereri]|uniref:C-C motif chemokine 14-like n=1 Tax=Pygocentrus nattereri TaxID=42514 RepID=UPI0008147BF3|nr:C-C motif chemokine 14-like [Pygocentrus nattereri]
MEMKMRCVCLVLGLVLLMTASSDSEPHGAGHPDECCFTFSDIKIPPKRIIKVEKTSSDCPQPGYIVTTVKNKFCKHEIKELTI